MGNMPGFDEAQAAYENQEPEEDISMEELDELLLEDAFFEEDIDDSYGDDEADYAHDPY